MINVLIGLVAFSALGIALIAYIKQRFWRDSLRDTQRRLYLVQARLNELEQVMQKELQILRQEPGPKLSGPSNLLQLKEF